MNIYYMHENVDFVCICPDIEMATDIVKYVYKFKYEVTMHAVIYDTAFIVKMMKEADGRIGYWLFNKELEDYEDFILYKTRQEKLEELLK